ncbi:hypothetical protein V0R37_17985 [Pollutimonas sp. H1-120]|uniref:hypothetical protein n=1 Tax=Pollutimonas sp. H1-120 TaxID=3148824 RepID=UPI003B52BC68
MTRAWRKTGLLYTPEGALRRHPKLLTHAANPLAVHMKEDIFRIFYSGRDSNNRSSVGAVDIDIVQKRVITDHFEPFFEHGPTNSFYADGISIGNCYTVGGITYMLFMGWQANPTAHWRGDIGRFVVTPELTLRLDQNEPFISSDKHDPISLSYPWVMAHQGGLFSMWYGSTISWTSENKEMIHVINFASSSDGHLWRKHGLAVPYELGKAQAFSRPTVVQTGQSDYEMWFSYRSGLGTTYRIGHAYSKDGSNWRLSLETTGIDISSNGWDSEMIEYPFVFDHGGQRYMLYNGNGYGKTGFGLAIQG